MAHDAATAEGRSAAGAPSRSEHHTLTASVVRRGDPEPPIGGPAARNPVPYALLDRLGGERATWEQAGNGHDQLSRASCLRAVEPEIPGAWDRAREGLGSHPVFN